MAQYSSTIDLSQSVVSDKDHDGIIHGGIKKISSSNLKSNQNKDLGLLGVSVHWLTTGFINEVKEYKKKKPFSRIFYRPAKSLTINEIENLDGPAGMIRSKGINTISPIDNKVGASYVHCLQGKDNVGKATVMLSYTWEYSVGTIVDTLDDWCQRQGLDPQRTYVWICSLCVNQHRVAEQKKSGRSALGVNFFEEFGHRVTMIGKILSLMGPWDEPAYLTRIWCIFEVFWAEVNKCKVEIIMSREQQNLMTDAIVGDSGYGLDKLYEVLSNITIQKADASFQEDKEQILNMIETRIGFTSLNNSVKELFRQWVRNTVVDHVKNSEEELNRNCHATSSDSITFLDLCFLVGKLLFRNGEFDKSLEMYKKWLVHHEKVSSFYNNAVFEIDESAIKWQKFTKITRAYVHNNIGTVLEIQGDYEGAILEHGKALSILEFVLPANHPDIALTYDFLGSALSCKRDYDGALIEYTEALIIREATLPSTHLSLATSHSNIGVVLGKKCDYASALLEHKKALSIQESVLHPKNLALAKTYVNIGSVLQQVGDYGRALIEYQKAMEVELLILHEDHPDLAILHCNIGSAMKSIRDYDGALVRYKEALRIQEAVLGHSHIDLSILYSEIGSLLVEIGDYDGALEQYRVSLTIQESVLQPNHPDIAETYNNIGIAQRNKGDYDGALIECTKSLEKRRSEVGETHADLANSYNAIGSIYQLKGDYEEAMLQSKKAYGIYKVTLGQDHPLTLDAAETIATIGDAMLHE